MSKQQYMPPAMPSAQYDDTEEDFYSPRKSIRFQQQPQTQHYYYYQDTDYTSSQAYDDDSLGAAQYAGQRGMSSSADEMLIIDEEQETELLSDYADQVDQQRYRKAVRPSRQFSTVYDEESEQPDAPEETEWGYETSTTTTTTPSHRLARRMLPVIRQQVQGEESPDRDDEYQHYVSFIHLRPTRH